MRYLRGILKRLEKLPAAEQRDARGMAGVLTLQNKYLARRAQVKGAGACSAGRVPLAAGGAADIAVCPGTENPVSRYRSSGSTRCGTSLPDNP